MLKQDTENIIKEAARKIFHEKGFAATKTREIADEAGINLALLNYYFRSKRKLFDLIMTETIQHFFSGVITVLEEEDTTLKEKISLFVDRYIDMLSANPNVVVFILNEVRDNPESFIKKIGHLEKAKNSVFLKQFMEEVGKGTIPPINPIHFMMNVMGLVVFPFIATPMISAVTGFSKETIVDVIQERKRLIPLWIESMLSVK